MTDHPVSITKAQLIDIREHLADLNKFVERSLDVENVEGVPPGEMTSASMTESKYLQVRLGVQSVLALLDEVEGAPKVEEEAIDLEPEAEVEDIYAMPTAKLLIENGQYFLQTIICDELTVAPPQEPPKTVSIEEMDKLLTEQTPPGGPYAEYVYDGYQYTLSRVVFSPNLEADEGVYYEDGDTNL